MSLDPTAVIWLIQTHNWQHSSDVSTSAFLTVNHGKFPKQEDSYAFEEDSSSESLSPDQHHSDESQFSACPSSDAVGSAASSSSSPVLTSPQQVTNFSVLWFLFDFPQFLLLLCLCRPPVAVMWTAPIPSIFHFQRIFEAAVPCTLLSIRTAVQKVISLYFTVQG